MRIVTIVGARPQFIKAAPVHFALRDAGVNEIIVHTGQHYDDKMSRVFFEELGIPEPIYNLGVGSASHGAQTGRMLEMIEHVLLDEVPDCVLVYGDTNSTLAGALAAVKLHIPIGHVEAGLRSFDVRMPEEINRIVTDHIADVLFAPTAMAVENLQHEGITNGRVHLVGDVMYDTALLFGLVAESKKDSLQRFGVGEKQYVLLTLHRADNTDDGAHLATIMNAMVEISSDLPVVMPVHPRTRKALAREGILENLGSGISLIDPVGYVEMILLEKYARLIATDSGGVQKEAFFQRTPCVTLRDTTEWVELLTVGWNRLAPPTTTADIVAAVRCALQSSPDCTAQLYGDGHASNRIAEILMSTGSKNAAYSSINEKIHANARSTDLDTPGSSGAASKPCSTVA